MPERVGVKVRRLPDGSFQGAQPISIQGRLWQLGIADESLQLSSLVEIEQGSTLYWGAVQQVEGSTATVWIEHCLDRARLQSIRELWGE